MLMTHRYLKMIGSLYLISVYLTENYRISIQISLNYRISIQISLKLVPVSVGHISLSAQVMTRWRTCHKTIPQPKMSKTTDAEWYHWDKMVDLTEIELFSHYTLQQFWGNSHEFQRLANVWSTHNNIIIHLILTKFSKKEKSTHDISSMSLSFVCEIEASLPHLNVLNVKAVV